MRVVMFMASQYGLECYRAVKEIKDVVICGILTTPAHFELKYEKNKTKEMDNTIYHDVIAESETKNIPVYVTDKMNNEKSVSVIRNWKPDLIVVSGWYHIIKEEILGIPPKGIIGLHTSLLPQYRGGAPLVWQMINGEKKAGITLFYMDHGTDTGDVIGQREVAIEEEDDIGTLYQKVGKKGIELLQNYIPQIAENVAPRKQQPDACGGVQNSIESIRREKRRMDGLTGRKNRRIFITLSEPRQDPIRVLFQHTTEMWFLFGNVEVLK